ncbi:MAG: prepilin-type N-terminal cleavage/methylation domain-containing protein [Candidatus Omnitrophica bacterium]|nr:prepilin-type N-terminal cleavage/methylation domain-containing protein [Candidatus Omnitrophota bacterium]
MRPARAFTLIELLVTLSLLALVAGTVTATLSGGLRVWERAAVQDTQERWIQVAFEQMRRDLQNTLRFSPVAFKGEYDVCSFPSVVQGPGASAPEREVGRLGYFLKEQGGILCRSQQPYRLMRRQRLKEDCHAMADGLERLRFAYYTFDSQDGEYHWSDRWESAEPPVAVKIELGYRGRASKRPVSRTMVVHVPTATIR